MKELLIEDEGHAADLLNLRLRRRVPVDEISGDGDGELAPELLAPKPCRKMPQERLNSPTCKPLNVYRTHCIWRSSFLGCVVQREIMVPYSTGVPYASVPACEAPTLKGHRRPIQQSLLCSALLGKQIPSEVICSSKAQILIHTREPE